MPGLVFSDKAIFILSQTAGSEWLAHPLDCRVTVEVTFVRDEYARCLPLMVVLIGPISSKMLSLITVMLIRYVVTGSLMSDILRHDVHCSSTGYSLSMPNNS